MKTTVIVKGKSEVFWKGNGNTIRGLDNLNSRELYYELLRLHRDIATSDTVTFKHETGQFQHGVEWNKLFKSGATLTHKKEHRKGYVLVTFNLARA